MGFNGWFRRNQKRVYIVMIFAMGAWGIGSSAVFFIPQKTIGTVLNEKITKDEFVDFDNRWRKVVLSGYKGVSLDLIWKQLVYERAAHKSGIVITDNDIMEGIYDLARQKINTGSNMPAEQLIMVLCNVFRVNRSQLLQTVKEVMTIHKLDYFLRSSVKVTAEEGWQRYLAENSKVKLKYVEFAAKNFINSVDVTDEEVEGFYSEYKDLFPDKTTGSYGFKEDEKVRIEYVLADFSEMLKHVSVTPEELSKYYEDNKGTEFVAPVKETVDDESAKGEDGKVKYKSFVEVQEVIKNNLLKQKAKDYANELISKVDEVIYESIDKLNRPTFKELANEYGLVYKVPKEGRGGSEFMTSDELERVLIGKDRLSSLAFGRDKFDPSPPLEALDGKYIFQVIDKQFSMSPQLSEIKDKVESDLKTEKAFRKARELAEQCLKKMQNSSFESGYDSFVADTGFSGLELGETEYLNRASAVSGTSPHGYIVAMQDYRLEVLQKAFKLKDKEMGLAVENRGNKACYIVVLAHKKDVDRSEYEKNKEKVLNRFKAEKQKYTLKKWEDDISKRSNLKVKL